MLSLTIHDLRELLAYNAETGKLTWLPRERGWFKTARAYRCWNTRWAGKPALNAKRTDGYFGGKALGKDLLAHRVIWALVYEHWPEQIDHINHDREDNRIGNLRSVPHEVNARNQKLSAANTSGRAGVRYCSRDRVWVARYYSDGKRISRHFNSFEEACAERERFETASGYHPNHGKELAAA